MKAISLRPFLLTGLVLAAAAILVLPAMAGRELVKFPVDYAGGVLYATVERGDLKEEIFTSRAAIEAVKQGRPLPSGTVITLVEYKGNPLRISRYIVMEKHTGWGSEYPPELRNGEWEYQAFHADKSVNAGENIHRCFSCHKSSENTDFVFTRERMKSVK